MDVQNSASEVITDLLTVEMALAPVKLQSGSLPVVVSTTTIAGTASVTPIQFDRHRHMTVGDGDPQMPWRSLAGQQRSAIKWGQLKLWVTEIQFLTLYLDLVKHPHPIVVYVGAALGIHIAGLADMFPPVTFHLFDFHPKRKRVFHEVLEDDAGKSRKANVQLFQRYFTDADVATYAAMPSVYFITDIRSLSYDKSKKTEADNRRNEKMAWDDMLLQQRWVLGIKPVRALLKLRFPYCYDFVQKEIGPTCPYLAGVVYLQPWTSPSSTETRLVPNDTYNTQEWDYPAVEGMLFAHNTGIRESGRFLNPLDLTPTPVAPELGFTMDWDSTFTVMVVMDYLRFVGALVTKPNVVSVLAVLVGRANVGRTTLVGLRAGIRNLEDDPNDDR